MFPKLHHGTVPNPQAVADLANGWASRWRNLRVSVSGWGWLEDDPEGEAEIAVALCRRYDLDGYIANAESAYEHDGWWKSAVFVHRFRELAPRAPLALSHIGWGMPYRPLDFKPWLDAGACLMPQCYEGNAAMPVGRSLESTDALHVPRARVIPTLGTSGFPVSYPTVLYAAEVREPWVTGFNVWLLESTNDDTLRRLGSPA